MKKRISRFLENQLFFLLQLLIVIITIFLTMGSSLSELDIRFRKYFMSERKESVYALKPWIKQNQQDITLIGIDSKFFNKENISFQGLHRGYYASGLYNILKYNPSVVGVDVFFEKTYSFTGQNQHTQELNKAFSKFDKIFADVLDQRVVLASLYDFDTHNDRPPASLFRDQNVKLGHTHSLEPYKGMVLGINSILTDVLDNKPVLPLSVKTFLEGRTNLLNKNSSLPNTYEIKQTQDFITLKMKNYNFAIPKIHTDDDRSYIFTPLYISDANEINYISMYDLIQNNFDPKDITDKYVFIGATDVTLNDIKPTLLGTMPGVLIHINQTLALMNKDAIFTLDKMQFYTLIFTIIFLNIVIVYIFKRTRAHIQILFLLLAEIIIILIGGMILALAGMINFLHIPYSIFLPVGTLILLISIQLMINLIYSFSDTYGLKENFSKLFSLYVGEKLTAKAEQQNTDIARKNAGVEKNVAIYFSDIQNFSNISEHLNPTQNIKLLNEHLEKISEQIVAHNGFIDKYIGDAVMAFWEDEPFTDKIALTAIRNIQDLPWINQNIREKLHIDFAKSLPDFEDELLKIRIGLHYGKAIIGNIGFEKQIKNKTIGKWNYTLIGDNVNLAARLEGVNKFYGSQICMSAEFWEKIQRKQSFFKRKLDRIKVKGRKSPVEIYELFPFYKDFQSDKIISTYVMNDADIQKLNEFIGVFEKGFNDYTIGNFESAIQYFTQANYIIPDIASLTFIQRCEYLIQKGPIQWDGIWQMDSK